MNAAEFLEQVRQKQPLVHHLTNWVTIYDCAQVVKSFGASPVMAHATEEAADMASIASALVLNIGTLTTQFVASMKLAAASANRNGIPVVLDVCGAGATAMRDVKCIELLNETRIDIIKGNASEIARIAGESVNTKGVDAGVVEKNLCDLAQHLAASRKCTVVITGAEDIVSDGSRCLAIRNGHEMMSRVVGTGCMAASVIGTFAAVSKGDLVAAAASGLSCYEIAAELAVKRSDGPGTFKQALFDAINALDGAVVLDMQRITECAAITS
jgi:hydroxyethylthiazole kinase